MQTVEFSVTSICPNDLGLLICDLVLAFCYMNALLLKSVRCFYGMGLCCYIVKISKPVVTVLVPKEACACKLVASMGTLGVGRKVFAVRHQTHD